MATCESNGHLWGGQGKCIFCMTPMPAVPTLQHIATIANDTRYATVDRIEIIQKMLAVAASAPEPQPVASNALLSCPFCGTQPAFANANGLVWLGCVNAKACGVAPYIDAETADEASTLWNRRAALEPRPVTLQHVAVIAHKTEFAAEDRIEIIQKMLAGEVTAPPPAAELRVASEAEAKEQIEAMLERGELPRVVLLHTANSTLSRTSEAVANLLAEMRRAGMETLRAGFDGMSVAVEPDGTAPPPGRDEDGERFRWLVEQDEETFLQIGGQSFEMHELRAHIDAVRASRPTKGSDHG